MKKDVMVILNNGERVTGICTSVEITKDTLTCTDESSVTVIFLKNIAGYCIQEITETETETESKP